VKGRAVHAATRRAGSRSPAPRRDRSQSTGLRRAPDTGGPPPPPDDGDRTAPWFFRRPLLILLIAILIVYLRIFSAGFVLFDDDFQVYANPFLNPPTLQSVARFWQHAYHSQPPSGRGPEPKPTMARP
jgi:hypothetical protein